MDSAADGSAMFEGARTMQEIRQDSLVRSLSMDTMSSVGTAYSESGSWDDVGAHEDEDFMGLEENDPLAPFVHEEVKEAVLVPLPINTVKTIWSPSYSTIMEGMLFKKGRARTHSLQPRNWKHRYFKLQSNGDLCYYKNHHKKGSFSLTGKNVRLCAGTSFRTCIEPKTGHSRSTQWRFSIRTEHQEIVLAARTKNEMQKWLTVVRALCEARSSSVDLFMNLEIEVDPKTVADLATASPRTIAATQEPRRESCRRRAQSAMSPCRPNSIANYSHHFDTFTPKGCKEVQFDALASGNDTGGDLGERRVRANTIPVQSEIFTKAKDWNERDGVLRIVRINDVPPTVFQPKYTMKVQVKI